MKEHFQDYGIRKWAGNDLIELQSEPLEALQKLVEPYAPCILQGCEVTENEGENDTSTITVEPGLVALQGKDYKGEDCVKIARFAGIANEKPSIYLTLECEPDKRVYGDSKSKAIAYHYRAVATTQKPTVPYMEINTSGNKRLVDTLGITQKLDREGGNASDVKVAFNDKGTDTEDFKSSNTLSKLFGGIKKWLDGKVDKVDGKGLVSVDSKLDASSENPVQNKLVKKALDEKVDKDPKRGLSECDFTQAEKDKLGNIAAGANNYTLPLASESVLGGIKTGFTSSANNRAVLLSNEKAYVNIPTSTIFSTGLMSKNDKSKLDGIDAGANKTIVDTSLDASSENPVQNNVVKEALDGKADSSHTHAYLPLSGGTITGNLRLKGSGNYGNKLNFGDSEYVYLHEETDDALTIKANEIKLNAASGGVNVTAGQLKENGSRVYSPNNNPPLATTSAAGFMSATDKTKLDACVQLHYLGYVDANGNLTRKGGSMNITVSKMATTGIYYLYGVGNNNKNVVVIINPTESDVYARYRRILYNGTVVVELEDYDGKGVYSPFMFMILGV